MVSINIQGIITEPGSDEGTELEQLKKSRSQKMNHTPNFDVMDKNNEFNNNTSVDKPIDFFRLQLSNPTSLLKSDNKVSISSNSKTIHSNPLQVSVVDNYSHYLHNISVHTCICHMAQILTFAT